MNRVADNATAARRGVCAAALWLCLLGSNSQAQQQDYAAELPRIPPLSPAEAMSTFQVADGFQIQQVAAEPLVTSPVAIQWDADGRMYVCEMRGYSEDRDQALSRITRLEDLNDDGVYDTSVVFADALLWPTALFPYDGGLFVGDAPDLYYFKDLDGDGKADTRQTVLTGFGTSNVQGLLNSFRWGLDNRLHVACSSVGGKIRRSGQSESEAIEVRGRDIALDPRDGTFELTSGAAQHGMCFDDWGRKFVSSNSDHIQQVMYEDRYLGRNPYLRSPPARISIAADGPQAEVFRISPVEPWRIVRTRLRVGGLVPGPIEGGGRAAGYFTGATGVTIYRGDAWPEPMKGIAIVGDVGSNLVHRKRLDRDGLVFTARRIDAESEFVASTDVWFRPAQFAGGPDGSLHVIDVCREVIEHPASLPPEIKRHLDLTSGRDRGRIYRVVPTGFRTRQTPRLSTATSDELVALLEHPNAWHRETAARLLFERQDRSAAAGLIRLARQSGSPLGRMHAMYALSGLGQLDSDTLLERLGDPHEQVRRHALRLSESLPGSAVLAQRLGELADDDSIEVRYQLAFTVGQLPAEQRVETLRRILRRDAGDIWMQTAVQSSLSDAVAELFALLVEDEPFLRSPAAAAFLQQLAQQISQQDRSEDLRRAVQAIERLPADDAGLLLPLIAELLRTRGRAGSGLTRLSESGQLDTIDQLRVRLIKAAIQRAADEDLDNQARVSAIAALAFGAMADVEPTLVSLIDTRQPDRVQQAAITSLGSFSSPRVAAPILAAWRGLSPQLRQTASDVLYMRPERTVALLDAVEDGTLSVADLDKARLQIAARSNDAEVRSRAEKYLALSATPRRDEVVAAYRSALGTTGDIERGRAHFRKHCAACHKVEDFGHEIGPNLATIKSRGAETVLVNVLDPSREVNPQYLNYIAVTVDGRTLTGMIVAESATSITLGRAEAAQDTILRVDLEQLQSTGRSIMPEGLEEAIDPQAMADLLAYLLR
jgi:putative membrane-bound dehydrogenase-like protein